MTEAEMETIRAAVVQTCIDGPDDFGECAAKILPSLPSLSFPAVLKAVDRLWCLERPKNA